MLDASALSLLKKEDIVQRSKWICPHGHTGLDHDKCWDRLHSINFGERIGFLDIETTDLNADYGIICCYAIKDANSKKIYTDNITKQDIKRYASNHRDVEPKEDTRVIQSLVKDMKNFDRLVLHFGCGFDIPFIRTRAVICRVPFPQHGLYVMSDTWVMLKKKFKLSRNSLENGCRKLVGITNKDHLSMSIKHGALRGEDWAIGDMLNHCLKDVLDTEALYNLINRYSKKTKTLI
jgi:uncharacterized protein YprB with RNaseH-like and TPR domain